MQINAGLQTQNTQSVYINKELNVGQIRFGKTFHIAEAGHSDLKREPALKEETELLSTAGNVSKPFFLKDR